MREPSRSDYSHLTPLRVKWGEMDSLGHVNNTVFFRYSEDGRIDYIERITEGVDTGASDGPILADVRCSFRHQLRFPADVEIASRVRRMGRSSLDMEQCLFIAGDDEPVAVFINIIVWFDYEAQTSAPVPEPIRERIRRLEPIAPEE